MTENSEKADMYDFPLHDYTQEQNGSPYFSSIVRQCKWPSLSRRLLWSRIFPTVVTWRHISPLCWRIWWKSRAGGTLGASLEMESLLAGYLVVLQETGYILIQKSTGKGFHCTHPSDCRSLSSIFVDLCGPLWTFCGPLKRSPHGLHGR